MNEPQFYDERAVSLEQLKEACDRPTIIRSLEITPYPAHQARELLATLSQQDAPVEVLRACIDLVQQIEKWKEPDIPY